VLKQFQFASTAGWSVYDAYEREIQVLQGLNYPGIPHYLNSFETDDGFCLVQEYKNAPSLAKTRRFDPEEVKHIAVSLLEILIYLQNRIPPVIHRDIKPENVLVSEDLQVYLVDFGFARIGEGEVAASSVVKGTLGFMPPEQLFNRQLTEASDLYGVGATLICLLTGTKSNDIGDLIDDNYCIHFKPLVPKLSLPWIAWLDKMVQPVPANRYPNAKVALEALKPIDVNRVPAANAIPEAVILQASQLGETLTATVMLSNSIPDTVLMGRWEFVSHPNDLPNSLGKHPWIHVSPDRIEGNRTLCKIKVETHQLQANALYRRQLRFCSNAEPETLSIDLTVKTAPAPIRVPIPPFRRIFVLFAVAMLLSFGVDTWWGTTLFLARSIAHSIDKLWSM